MSVLKKLTVSVAVLVVIASTAYHFRYPLLLKFAQTMMPLFQPEIVEQPEIA